MSSEIPYFELQELSTMAPNEMAKTIIEHGATATDANISVEMQGRIAYASYPGLQVISKSIEQASQNDAFVKTIYDDINTELAKRVGQQQQTTKPNMQYNKYQSEKEGAERTLEKLLQSLKDKPKEVKTTPLTVGETKDLIHKECDTTLQSQQQQVDKFLKETELNTRLIHSSAEKKATEKLQEKIVEELAKLPPTKFEVKVADQLTTLNETTHFKFPLILTLMANRIPTMLVGPAGSGKTKTAHLASIALGLDFSFISVCEQTSEAKLLGYKDANGTYHATHFRRLYENGGVFLIDEIDNGNPNILAVLNSALANDNCAFPDLIVKKHDNFVCLAAANTYCLGADRLYVGRNQLDAATIDRFAFVDFPYDEGLEAAIIGLKIAVPHPDFTLDDGGIVEANVWYNRVTKIRGACERLKIRHIVSPRATIYGTKLLQAGVGIKNLDDILLWKGLKSETYNKILSEARL